LLPDHWRRVPIGGFARLDVERVDVRDGDTYPIAGVLNAGQGMLAREPLDASSTTYSKLHRLRTDRLVMRKLTAWEGPITVVPARYDGWFASPEFPTFALDRAQILPSFMRLICQLPSLWEAMKGTSTGTPQRRKRVTPQALLRIEVDLPPLRVQARIVSVLSCLDDTLEAAEREMLAAAQVSQAVQQRLVGQGDPRPVAAVASFAGGAAFPPSEQGRDEGDYPFFKVSDMNLPGNDRRMVKSTNWITEEQRCRLGVRVWPAGTVIFPKVGAALKTEKRRLLVRDSAFDNNVMGLLAKDDLVLPEYLLLLMERIQLARLAQEGAMPFVNQRTVGAIEVNLPPFEQQKAAIALMRTVEGVTSQARAYGRRLREARTSILKNLLAGKLEIEPSYDRFLREADAEGGVEEVAAA
jgi:type I restriction enzyme S subunit